MSAQGLVRAQEVCPGRLLHAVTTAFADYLIGPFRISLDQWPSFLARQAVDLDASRVVIHADSIISFALVSRRPRLGRWRLAMMGTLPQFRGDGSSRALLDDFISRAVGAGADSQELECFASNARALSVYRSRGFESVQRLDGWTFDVRADVHERRDVPACPTFEVSPDVGLAWLAEATLRVPDLPLQVTPESLAQGARPLRFWQGGQALMAFVLNDDGSVQIASLVDLDPRQVGAEQLARELLAAFPNRRISVPQLQRDDLGGEALLRSGFARLPLHQVLMVRQSR